MIFFPFLFFFKQNPTFCKIQIKVLFSSTVFWVLIEYWKERIEGEKRRVLITGFLFCLVTERADDQSVFSQDFTSSEWNKSRIFHPGHFKENFMSSK